MIEKNIYIECVYMLIVCVTFRNVYLGVLLILISFPYFLLLAF